MFIDPVYLLAFLLPGLILAAVASMLLTTFSRYARVQPPGMTGAQAVERTLRANGRVLTCRSSRRRVSRQIITIPPQRYAFAGCVRQHRLRRGCGLSRSRARPATRRRIRAAHACTGRCRPPTASMFAFYVFFAGLLFNSQSLVYIGCALFAVGFLFAVVTLPVDASARDNNTLATTGIVSPDQVACRTRN